VAIVWVMATHTIWKFPVALTDEFTITMPRKARPLTVQVQDGAPYVWALVDPGWVRVQRRFRLAGTGHPIEDAGLWQYVGSFQLRDGALVFHLFVWPTDDGEPS
jgi:hypothetical protein